MKFSKGQAVWKPRKTIVTGASVVGLPSFKGLVSKCVAFEKLHVGLCGLKSNHSTEDSSNLGKHCNGLKKPPS